MIVGEAIATVVLAALLVFVWDELFAILGTASSDAGPKGAASRAVHSLEATQAGPQRLAVPSPASLDAASLGTDAHSLRRHPL